MKNRGQEKSHAKAVIIRNLCLNSPAFSHSYPGVSVDALASDPVFRILYLL